MESTSNSSSSIKANLNDINSFANFHEIEQTFIALYLTINFDERVLKGRADITFKRNIQTDTLILDAKQINVNKIVDNETKKELTFNVDSNNPVKCALGTPISIDVNGLGEQFTLSFFYSTTPESDACQWLDKELTLTKNYPYLFTQCQAILARTLLPCQVYCLLI